MAFPAFALVTWAVVRSGQPGHKSKAPPCSHHAGMELVGIAAATTGLVLAGFSSPYQAVALGVLGLSLAFYYGRARLGEMALSSVLGSAVAIAYYAGAIRSDFPHPSSDREVASGIFDLWVPFANQPLDGPITRIRHLARPAQHLTSLDSMMWAQPVSTSYIGAVLLVLGLAGLWRARRTPLARGLATALLATLILSFGSSLRTWSTSSSPIPLPWALLAHLPYLGSMMVVRRFLSGASFCLVLGVGLLLQGRRRWWAAVACVALGADGLLRAPLRWPLPTARLDLSPLAEHLPTGAPLAAWPPMTDLEPRYFALLALELGRPLIVPAIDRPLPRPPSAGEALTKARDETEALRWFARNAAAGVRTAIWVETSERRPLYLPGTVCWAGACTAPLPAFPLEEGGGEQAGGD